MSVSCIGIHLSSNGLEYYDRVFLRTLINAKINYQFKNLAREQINGVRASREAVQVDQLDDGEPYNEELKRFIKTFDFIEKQRVNLDEQISNVLKEADINKVF